MQHYFLEILKMYTFNNKQTITFVDWYKSGLEWGKDFYHFATKF